MKNPKKTNGKKSKVQNRTSLGKRQNKKKKEVKRGTKGSNRKTGKKQTRAANPKTSRRTGKGNISKSSSVKKVQKQKKVRKVQRTSKFYVKPATPKKLRYKKGRGENLFEIDLEGYKDLQQKIEAIRADPFLNVSKFLKKQKREPVYVNVTLKDFNDETGLEYFDSYLSPSTMVVDTENTKQFILDSIVEHNDNNLLRILERYDDSDFTPNELIGVSFRFLFPY